MSRVDPTAAAETTPAAPAGHVPRPRRPRLSGLLRNELLTTFRRWRTLALLGVLVAVPVLVGIAVRIETGDGSGADGGGDGPAFLGQVAQNGLFLVFASLAATLPFFLPMTAGVVAGDAIAGEATSGTLRYLLVAPAGRTRLLAVKYATTMVFCLAATLVVALAALITGLLLFPVGDVTLLSGTSVSFGDGLLRALCIALAVALSLAGIAAIGLFVSTLTDSGVGAMAATVGLLVTVQIVDTIPQLHAVQPYLFPHYWLSFAGLLRDPVYWEPLLRNFGLQAVYVAVFGSAAWARFTTKDVTA
jgi:ABC-2 type transport system permease protein